MTLQLLDQSTPAGRQALQDRLARLRYTTAADSDAAKTVAQILADVRDQGDDALVRYMRQWTDPDFAPDRIRVTQKELTTALSNLDKPLRAAIERSIAHVREYQQHIAPKPVTPITLAGAELGLRWTPMPSAGLNVPGGAAVLFSTLIMLAVPALVAGVPADKIAVVNPPPTRKPGQPSGGSGGGGAFGGASGADISPIVMAVCALLGIDKLYRIGGAQAIAALAYGTNSVQRVEMIAGPGNIFTQLAKQQLAGLVGSDNGFYGPSEILTLADESSDPTRIASDLLAQAEHDPGKCFLIAWSRPVLEKILAEMDRQLPARKRIDAIQKALATESIIALVQDEQHAVDLANTLAAEHVNLAVAPDRMTWWLDRIPHAGEFFLGDATPVAAGDYYAGPSHCLPTGTTARFTSGVSVYTFLKRTGTVAYPTGMPKQAIADIALLADTEGLDAHAQSARLRAKKGDTTHF
ncbi:MAG: histidinol dehydrogenase [Phycisphaeraceae bacterium]|nr:histidinol dehydrogenase [Phycisphaeraceae bacterium]